MCSRARVHVCMQYCLPTPLCVAVSCSVLQGVAECCSVLQCVKQCVAVCFPANSSVWGVQEGSGLECRYTGLVRV